MGNQLAASTSVKPSDITGFARLELIAPLGGADGRSLFTTLHCWDLGGGADSTGARAGDAMGGEEGEEEEEDESDGHGSTNSTNTSSSSGSCDQADGDGDGCGEAGSESEGLNGTAGDDVRKGRKGSGGGGATSKREKAKTTSKNGARNYCRGGNSLTTTASANHSTGRSSTWLHHRQGENHKQDDAGRHLQRHHRRCGALLRAITRVQPFSEQRASHHYWMERQRIRAEAAARSRFEPLPHASPSAAAASRVWGDGRAAARWGNDVCGGGGDGGGNRHDLSHTDTYIQSPYEPSSADAPAASLVSAAAAAAGGRPPYQRHLYCRDPRGGGDNYLQPLFAALQPTTRAASAAGSPLFTFHNATQGMNAGNSTVSETAKNATNDGSARPLPTTPPPTNATTNSSPNAGAAAAAHTAHSEGGSPQSPLSTRALLPGSLGGSAESFAQIFSLSIGHAKAGSDGGASGGGNTGGSGSAQTTGDAAGSYTALCLQALERSRRAFELPMLSARAMLSRMLPPPPPAPQPQTVSAAGWHRTAATAEGAASSEAPFSAADDKDYLSFSTTTSSSLLSAFYPPTSTHVCGEGGAGPDECYFASRRLSTPLPRDVVVKVFVFTAAAGEDRLSTAAAHLGFAVFPASGPAGAALFSQQQQQQLKTSPRQQQQRITSQAPVPYHHQRYFVHRMHSIMSASSATVTAPAAAPQGFSSSASSRAPRRRRRGNSVLEYARMHISRDGPYAVLERAFVAYSLPERLAARPAMLTGGSERLFLAYQLLRALAQLHSCGDGSKHGGGDNKHPSSDSATVGGEGEGNTTGEEEEDTTVETRVEPTKEAAEEEEHNETECGRYDGGTTGPASSSSSFHSAPPRCHGDLKPNNVLVQSTGWLYLADLAPFKPAVVPSDNPALYHLYYDSDDTRGCYLAPEKFAPAADIQASRHADRDNPFLPQTERRAAEAAGVRPSALTKPPASSGGRGGYCCLANVNAYHHTRAMDIFSAGCVLAFILCDEPLLSHSDTLALSCLQQRGKAPEETGSGGGEGRATEAELEAEAETLVRRALRSKGLGGGGGEADASSAAQLLLEMLRLTPAKRPSAAQLLDKYTGTLFPPSFAVLCNEVLPDLLAHPSDAQAALLAAHLPGLLDRCVALDTGTAADVGNETARRTAEETDADLTEDHRTNGASAGQPEGTRKAARARLAVRGSVARRACEERVLRVCLPVMLHAARTCLSDDAVLRALTTMRRLLPRCSPQLQTDVLLPQALYIAGQRVEAAAPARIVALRLACDAAENITRAAVVAHTAAVVCAGDGESESLAETPARPFCSQSTTASEVRIPAPQDVGSDVVAAAAATTLGSTISPCAVDGDGDQPSSVPHQQRARVVDRGDDGSLHYSFSGMYAQQLGCLASRGGASGGSNSKSETSAQQSPEAEGRPLVAGGAAAAAAAVGSYVLEGLVLPCVAELVHGAFTGDDVGLAVEVATQLPRVLLLARHAAQRRLARGGGGGSGGTPRVSSPALEELLEGGWALCQLLFSHPAAAVVAALARQVTRVAAFVGERRAAEDLIPLLTTLVALPAPALQRTLYRDAIAAHLTLRAPPRKTLLFFATEGLRDMGDSARVAETLAGVRAALLAPARDHTSADATSYRRQRRGCSLAPAAAPLLGPKEGMRLAHAALPFLLSSDGAVQLAACRVVEAAAAVYRPCDVRVHLWSAVRPLLAPAAVVAATDAATAAPSAAGALLARLSRHRDAIRPDMTVVEPPERGDTSAAAGGRDWDMLATHTARRFVAGPARPPCDGPCRTAGGGGDIEDSRPAVRHADATSAECLRPTATAAASAHRHRGAVHALCTFPGGRVLSAGAHGEALVWELRQRGGGLAWAAAHGTPRQSAAHANGFVECLEATEWSLLGRLPLPPGPALRGADGGCVLAACAARVHGQGSWWAALGTADGRVLVMDVASRAALATLHTAAAGDSGGGGGVTDVCMLSPSVLLAATATGEALLYDLRCARGDGGDDAVGSAGRGCPSSSYSETPSPTAPVWRASVGSWGGAPSAVVPLVSGGHTDAAAAAAAAEAFALTCFGGAVSLFDLRFLARTHEYRVVDGARGSGALQRWWRPRRAVCAGDSPSIAAEMMSDNNVSNAAASAATAVLAAAVEPTPLSDAPALLLSHGDGVVGRLSLASGDWTPRLVPAPASASAAGLSAACPTRRAARALCCLRGDSGGAVWTGDEEGVVREWRLGAPRASHALRSPPCPPRRYFPVSLQGQRWRPVAAHTHPAAAAAASDAVCIVEEEEAVVGAAGRGFTRAPAASPPPAATAQRLPHHRDAVTALCCVLGTAGEAALVSAARDGTLTAWSNEP